MVSRGRMAFVGLLPNSHRAATLLHDLSTSCKKKTPGFDAFRLSEQKSCFPENIRYEGIFQLYRVGTVCCACA